MIKDLTKEIQDVVDEIENDENNFDCALGITQFDLRTWDYLTGLIKALSCVVEETSNNIGGRIDEDRII